MVVVLHTFHRGQRETILFPYLVHFSTLYYYLLVSKPMSIPLFPCHCSPPLLVCICCRYRPILGPYQVYTCLLSTPYPHPYPPVFSTYPCTGPECMEYLLTAQTCSAFSECIPILPQKPPPLYCRRQGVFPFSISPSPLEPPYKPSLHLVL